MVDGLGETTLGRQQNTQIAEHRVREPHVSELARGAECQVELGAGIRHATLLLQEQSEVAMAVALPSALACFAGQPERPLIETSCLLQVSECVVNASQVAEE